MKNKFLKTGFFAAAVLFGLNAQAQDAEKEVKVKRSPEKMIERLDTDKDGKLSLEEVSATKKGKLAENFETIDADADGLIDTTELEAHLESRKDKKKKKKS